MSYQRNQHPTLRALFDLKLTYQTGLCSLHLDLSSGTVRATWSPGPIVRRSQKRSWRGTGCGNCTKTQNAKAHQERYLYPAKSLSESGELKDLGSSQSFWLYEAIVDTRPTGPLLTWIMSWVIPVRSVQNFVNTGWATGLMYSWNWSQKFKSQKDIIHDNLVNENKVRGSDQKARELYYLLGINLGSLLTGWLEVQN